MMRPLFLALLVLAAAPAQAQCFASWKAKQDAPLRLIYGVSEVPDAACSKKAAKAELAPRLAAAGWTLLTVVSVFGPEGLAQRKDSSGAFFLRY
ncbi:hypothetical protein [Rhodobacter capsulatus]|uniref:hypothetical protein n=1 Tax=Rhodobacter capsulatus TaxID=1061 RepID=UPI0003D2C34B|nr:hypothetical protein [Rhodobacter capsulatus]ETD84227.1 hypothetical protein U716_06915 [Rhodobacter capsulatus B6]